MTKLKYITLTNNGYQVRIHTESKWFGFVACGGRDNALDQAKKYRKDLLQKLDMSLDSDRRSKPRQIGKTKTGIIGITRYENHWRAHHHSRDAGKQKNKQFSITKYGNCEAFEMACKYRYEKCGTLRVYRNHEFPCAIPVPFEYIDNGQEN